MSLESDLLTRITRIIDSVEKRVSAVENAQRTGQTQTVSTPATQAISAGETGIITYRQEPYHHILAVKAPNRLQATEKTFQLPHPADHIVVRGTVDYQVAYDANVQTTTPITSAYSDQSFALRVEKKINYVIPQEFLNSYPGATGDMYIWMLWY